MTEPYLAAAVQMTSTPDKADNLERATRLVERAAARGAALIVLPEMFNCLGDVQLMVAAGEEVPGPTSEAMSQLAAQLGVTLLAGSIPEQSDQADHVYNTALLFGPDGPVLARYRKLHLFQVDIPGQVTLDESSWAVAGEEVTAVDTPQGKTGIATCYDLRFPELFRRLSDEQVELLLTPSAFTAQTGRDHWELLVRARAVESQCYVIAANQYGRHSPQMASYGRSMIVDPWGTPLATAPDEETIILAEINPERVQEVRERLPALKNRWLK